MTQEKYDEILTVKEVAAKLKKCELTIRQWLQDGRLRGNKIGHRWAVRQSEVDRIAAGEGK